ncbi:methyl-accepting chemotaxis protein [Bacillus ectoiniformans]|uniref:methyl-accepting chemotaxis protein n=1 Tax=Bacillus ectoiniformans TaxID=1494429 RepID=UPI003B82EAAE
MNSSDESVRAMEEISIGVQRIAESSSEVSESAIHTTKEAQQGKSKIENVVKQMDSIRSSVHEGMEQIKDLNAHSDEIGQIISVITQISDQTNLLALNAAIEAARAGEHGKGFAVVAEEVRKLAEESKKSADQISTLITTLQQATNQSVSVIRKSESEVERGMEEVASAGEAFTHILQSIENVAEQIQEVSATSEEISASSEEVTASVAEMSTIAQKTTTSTKDVVELSKSQLSQIGENIEAIEQLRQLAAELQENVHRFKL